MLYLLLLLLSACTTTPTTYQRGSLAPAPAPVRPGVGAPVYDPPHAPGPRMQPQPPPTRFLPETPGGGPGIWASSTPDQPTILGTSLPRGVDEDDPVTRTSRACAGLMGKALLDAAQDLSAWTSQERRCLGSILYFMCAHDDAGAYSRRRPALDRMTANRLKVLAEQLRDRECRPTLPGDRAPVRHAIEAAYLALDGR
jgi:hypothetical protein